MDDVWYIEQKNRIPINDQKVNIYTQIQMYYITFGQVISELGTSNATIWRKVSS